MPYERGVGVAQRVERLICNQQVAGSSPATSSIKGGVPKWPKGADCKSAGRMPSEVQILPPPPDLSGEVKQVERSDRSQVFEVWKQKLLHDEEQGQESKACAQEILSKV